MAADTRTDAQSRVTLDTRRQKLALGESPAPGNGISQDKNNLLDSRGFAWSPNGDPAGDSVAWPLLDQVISTSSATARYAAEGDVVQIDNVVPDPSPAAPTVAAPEWRLSIPAGTPTLEFTIVSPRVADRCRSRRSVV